MDPKKPIKKKITVPVDYQEPCSSRQAMERDMHLEASSTTEEVQNLEQLENETNLNDYLELLNKLIEIHEAPKVKKGQAPKVPKGQAPQANVEKKSTKTKKGDSSTKKSTSKAAKEDSKPPSGKKGHGKKGKPLKYSKKNKNKTGDEAPSTSKVNEEVKVEEAKVEEENFTERIYLFLEDSSDDEKASKSKENDGDDSDTMEDFITPKYLRQCASCLKILKGQDSGLTWEVMYFCNELCLMVFHLRRCPICVRCEHIIKTSMIFKYYLRHGEEMNSFCSKECFEKHPRKGCFCCGVNMAQWKSEDVFWITDEEHPTLSRIFCSEFCWKRYYQIVKKQHVNLCVPDAICPQCKNVQGVLESEIVIKDTLLHFCSDPCLVQFMWDNEIEETLCMLCRQGYDSRTYDSILPYDQKSFCSFTCESLYVLINRKTVKCTWCTEKRFNFNMIKKFRNNSVFYACSLSCLSSVTTSLDAVKLQDDSDLLELGIYDGVKISAYRLHKKPN